MDTYKIQLVRSNNRTETVITLAESERDAMIVAPDYLTYGASEPRALPVSATKL